MRLIVRLGVGFFAANQAVLGVWALLFPLSFYEDFPTVDLTPPYSEHLMRDFGGATTGLAIVLASAALWAQTRLIVVALSAYLAFSAPHMHFHTGHLHGASDFEATSLMIQLALSVAVPVALIVLAVIASRKERAADPSSPPHLPIAEGG